MCVLGRLARAKPVEAGQSCSRTACRDLDAVRAGFLLLSRPLASEPVHAGGRSGLSCVSGSRAAGIASSLCDFGCQPLLLQLATLSVAAAVPAVTKTATRRVCARRPPLACNKTPDCPTSYCVRRCSVPFPLSPLQALVLRLLRLPLQPCFASQLPAHLLSSCKSSWSGAFEPISRCGNRRLRALLTASRQIYSAAQSNLIDFRRADGHKNPLSLTLA